MERLDSLGDQIRPWRREQRQRFATDFSVAEDLLQAGLEMLHRLDIRQDSLRPLVITSLWARCIEHFEATITLLEQGLLVPAQVALRALLEAVFTTAAMVKDEKVLDLYVKDDDIHRRKLARKLRATSDPRLAKHVDPQLEAELEEQIKAGGAKELKTEFFAQRADMTVWYLAVYSILGGPAHTKVRDLQRYLSTNEVGSYELSFRRNDIDLGGALSTAGILFVIAADHVKSTFQVEMSEARDKCLDHFIKLGDAMGQAMTDEGAQDLVPPTGGPL